MTNSSQRAARPQIPLPVQTKLKIGAANDPLEREADDIADRVMRMPDVDPSLLQRCPGGCPDDESLRRSSNARQSPVPRSSTAAIGNSQHPHPDVGISYPSEPAIEPTIQSIRGQGSPLPVETQQFFEHHLRRDFSHVRVHTNNRAAATAQAVNARAFTVGHDVVFATGEYAPSTTSGRRLIAHELAHVIQQQACNGAGDPHADNAQRSSSRPPNFSTCFRHATLQRSGGATPPTTPVTLPGQPTTKPGVESFLADGEWGAFESLVMAANEGEVVTYDASTKLLGAASKLTLWGVRQGGTTQYSRERYPGESAALTNQALIALADRSLKGPVSYTYNHYSVQFWSCDSGFADLNRKSGYSFDDIKSACNPANGRGSEAKKLDSIELQNDNDPGWEAWGWDGEDWELPCWPGGLLRRPIWISVIHADNTDESVRVMPIFSSDMNTAMSMWSKMRAVATSYPYAEQKGFNGNFQRWPDSMYMTLGTNSNTFVHHVVTAAGLQMTEMLEDHPGAWPPVPNTIAGYIFHRLAPPWKESDPDMPKPTFTP